MSISWRRNAVIAIIFLVLATAGSVWPIGPQPEPPDLKTFAIAKGTEVQKTGPQNYRFKLADRSILELTGVMRTSGWPTAVS